MRRLLLLAFACLLATSAAAQEDTGEVYRKGMELYRAGRFEEALPFFTKALDLAEARYGEESPLLALDLNNLAEIYRLLGRFDEAEPLYKRAVELDEAAGEDNPGLATSLNNLALLYRTQERLDEAEKLYKRSLVLLEKAVGPNHPDVAKGLNNLAVLYRLQGQAEKAQPLQARALRIVEQALGTDHPTTKLMRTNLDLVGGPPPEEEPVVARAEPPPSPVAKARPEGPAEPETVRTALARPTAGIALPPPGAAARAAQPAALVPPPPAAATPPAAGDGGFAVHVASVRDPTMVAAEWIRLSKRYPSLAGLELRPARSVEVAGKGTFYRVSGGRFATRGEAQAACDRLRAQGLYCSVLAP